MKIKTCLCDVTGLFVPCLVGLFTISTVQAQSTNPGQNPSSGPGAPPQTFIPGDPLITFDDPGITVLQPVTTQYAAEGVTFSGVDWSGNPVALDAANNTLYNDVDAYSPPNVLSDFYGGSVGNRAQIMQINFSSPASGISFYYNPAGYLGANTVFNAYNSSGTLIASFSDPNATGDGVWYLESIGVTGVSWLDIVSPGVGWGHYIDNLQFTEVVPEPSSMGLLFGICGLATLLVRRKTS